MAGKGKKYFLSNGCESVLEGDKGDREEKCSLLPLGFQASSLGIHATRNEKQQCWWWTYILTMVLCVTKVRDNPGKQYLQKWKFVNGILLLMSHNNSWLFLHGISDWGMMVCHQRPCLFIVQPLIRWLYIFSPHIAGKSWNQFVSDGLTLYKRKQGRAHSVITIHLQKLSKRNLGHKKMAVSLFLTSPNFTYSS